MNIAFVLTHPSKGSAGTFERMYEIASHLKSNKITPTILTPIQEDVERISDIEMQLIPSSFSKFKISTITYNFTRKFSTSKLTSGLFFSSKSIDKMVSTIEKGLRKNLNEKKYDILHAVQPIAGLACVTLSKEFNIPLVSEFNNIWPEEAVVHELIKNNDDTFNRLRLLEKTIVKNSDKINVVSEQLKNYLIEHYDADEEKIVLVPAAGRILQNANNTERKNNIVYAGMVNPRSNVDLFVNSIPYVKNSTSFFITNKGDALKKIKILLNKNSVNVNFFWYPKRLEVLDFLMQSKIGIAPFHDDITWKLGIPLKPFDYLSCGLPIVINDVDNWWTKVVKDENIGLVSSGDPKDFAEKIDTILSDDTLWMKMHHNAVNLIKNKYNWNNVVSDNLVPMYESLMKN